LLSWDVGRRSAIRQPPFIEHDDPWRDLVWNGSRKSVGLLGSEARIAAVDIGEREKTGTLPPLFS
jgi:hypothetical protein